MKPSKNKNITIRNEKTEPLKQSSQRKKQDDKKIIKSLYQGKQPGNYIYF